MVNAKDTGHNCDVDTVTAAQDAAGKPFDDAFLFRFGTESRRIKRGQRSVPPPQFQSFSFGSIPMPAYC